MSPSTGELPAPWRYSEPAPIVHQGENPRFVASFLSYWRSAVVGTRPVQITVTRPTLAGDVASGETVYTPGEPLEVKAPLVKPDVAPAKPDLAPPKTDPTPPKPEPAPPKPEPAPPKPEPIPTPKPEPAPIWEGLSADEQRMVHLVNEERVKAGLSRFEVDMRLVQTARIKSQDMITHNYFSHNSPTFGSPFDLIKAAGIAYRTAGENIAGNQSVDAAHQTLMRSPGHRANILNPSFTKIGIGIIPGGRYGLILTQQFIG